MFRSLLCLCLGLILLSQQLSSQQQLKPGFDPREYEQLLSLSFFGSSIPDSQLRKRMKDPYQLVYRSPEAGLLNRWQFFLRQDNVGVIELRGTVQKLASWLENFYGAMVPAQGTLQLNDSTRFEYKLAENPQAMVHVGWTIGIGHIGPAIVNLIREMASTKQVREFLIIGHSQGGALSQLLRSYLHYEQKAGHLPTDVFFKTYSSAAPKTGNLYYAYDFDFITRGQWAFTVVNSADWVPETPFSIQTLKDFNPTNPFTETKKILRKQKLLVRLAGKIIYNKIDRSTRKAQRRMGKYLGPMVYKQVKAFLPQLVQPAYAPGNNFMRAGVPVILMADAEYFTRFPEKAEFKFVHHLYESYSYLLHRYYF